jgi:predicted nuclease with TOPRIM domain
MLTKIKIGIIVILVIGITSLGYMYRSEVRKAATLAQELLQAKITLVETQERLEDEREERERVEKILQVRDSEREKLRSESAKLRRKFEELRHTDKATGIWADDLLPDAICDRLYSSDPEPYTD